MIDEAFTPLEVLEARFHALPAEYQSHKLTAESQAVSWEWASNCRYDPRPLYYERHRFPRGRKLRNPGPYQYGLDDVGRVLVERQATEYPGQFYETFYSWEGELGQAALYDYSPQKRPIAYWRLRYIGDRLSLFETRADGGISRERYIWNGNRIDRIEVLHSPVSRDEPVKEPAPWQVVETRYDEVGVLSEIRVTQQPNPPMFPTEIVEVAYQRPPSGLKYKELLRIVMTKLTEQIPAVLASYPMQERVYCLALWWSPGQFSSLPPTLGLGREAERLAWAAVSPNEVQTRAWHTAEFWNFGDPALDLREPELIRACELLNQEVNKRADDGAITRLLRDAAAALNRLSWTDILTVTDDFLVFAIAEDEALPQIRRSIKASVPDATYAALREKGWL